MRGISADLRERIIKRYKAGYKAEEVAAHYEVSLRSVYRYVALDRQSKCLTPRPPGGSQSIIKKHNLESTIRQIVNDKPDASLKHYVDNLAQRTNVQISIPSMCRALQRLGLPRKKRPNNPKKEMRQLD